MNYKNLQKIRDKYPAGSRVRLLHMDDPQAPPEGTEGTIRFVDDIGTIHVSWDTGSGLGVCLGVDIIEVI